MIDDQLVLAEARDPYLLDAAGAAALLRDAPWDRFAAVGDSGAAGVTEALAGYATRTWFDRVTAWLRAARPGLAQLNLGRRDALAREVTADQLPAVLRFAPDLTAVLAGGNDILQRRFDPAVTAAEITRVVTALGQAGSAVVLTGVFDITVSPYVPARYRAVMSERIGQLTRIIRDVAGATGALYVDLPAHPAATEAIYSTDGLHLNARGQAILAAEVTRRLGRHLSGPAA
jgi:lysophospholipase L1-like esterase